MSLDVVIFPDPESAISRAVQDLGLEPKSGVTREQMIDLEENLPSGMARLATLGGARNYCDALTKRFLLRSPTSRHPAGLLETGWAKMPISSFEGRANFTTRDLHGEASKSDRETGEGSSEEKMGERKENIEKDKERDFRSRSAGKKENGEPERAGNGGAEESETRL